MEKLIINECLKYGYKLHEKKENMLIFENEKVDEDLQIFLVKIHEELNFISMCILIDFDSWNESTEANINNVYEIKENIKNWLCEENLKKMSMFLES